MLPPEEEQALRDRLRQSLEKIVSDGGGSPTTPSPTTDAARLQEILTEETERFYEQKGLVKHLSRSGRMYWVTPEELVKISSRRSRRRKRNWFAHLDVRTVAIWIGLAVFTALLVAYLFATQLVE